MAAPNSYIKVSGVWKSINKQYVKVSGTWKQINKAYVKVGGVWKNIYSAVTPGSATYTVPGSYSYEIENYNTLQFAMWGAGGGSSGIWSFSDGYILYEGGDGSNTTITFGSYVARALGGEGGPTIDGSPSTPRSGTVTGGRATLSVAVGGPCTNAVEGVTAGVSGGNGGFSSNGGAVVVGRTSQGVGTPGNYPGGGAGGAKYTIFTVLGGASGNSVGGSGGGGGGYVYTTLTPGLVNGVDAGDSVSIVIGLQGAKGTGSSVTVEGAYGANGKAIISWI